MRRLLFAALLSLAAPAAESQMTQYERMYGSPVDVSIADIVQGGSFYTSRAIRTRGRLDTQLQAQSAGSGSTQMGWFLTGDFSYSLQIVPVPEIAQSFEDEARMRFGAGREMSITGIVRESPPQAGAPSTSGYVVEFWRFEEPPDRTKEALARAKSLSIADLVAKHGRYDGSLVRVAGAFRGRNLFTDLPAKSERGGSDWVLMDEDQALWVTGKKPKGDGWALDLGLQRDTGKWIEVVGRPETKDGITYLHAIQVALSKAPEMPTTAKQTPPPPEKPKVPPVVVFAFPLDGDTDVAGDSHFMVQFSKDMDESTFKDRVRLRYLGPPRPGVRPLDSVSWTYDGGRRTLVVDPGDRLRRGGDVELRLLPGIKDMDGLELIRRQAPIGASKARSEAAEQNPVDVLRYRVGT